jgi:hypothetical protein
MYFITYEKVGAEVKVSVRSPRVIWVRVDKLYRHFSSIIVQKKNKHRFNSFFF